MREAVDQIVDVKQRREDRAQEGVRRARIELEEAARRVERAADELDRYVRWRPAEEDRLWQGIEGRLVKLDDIDALKGEIGLLRGKEHLLTERRDEADRARTAAHRQLEAAQVTHAAAQRARQKFEELAEILDTEWRQALERQEELELEELAGMRVVDIEERLG